MPQPKAFLNTVQNLQTIYKKYMGENKRTQTIFESLVALSKPVDMIFTEMALAFLKIQTFCSNSFNSPSVNFQIFGLGI